MFGLLNSENSKRIRASRQQNKRLRSLGYRCHETDWEIHRGSRLDEIIIDAVISSDGKKVYTLLGKNKETASKEGE